MNQTFTLIPWEPTTANLAISGFIQRTANQFQIQYQLTGDLDTLIIPPPQIPQRCFALWEATCCEFFLAPPNAEHYWEFNLSPSGDWNVFRLDRYRTGLRDELAWETLPFQVNQQAGSLKLDLTLDLSKIIEPHQNLTAAVTTVIQHQSGAMSYWALCHQGETADFHQRDSFIIKLPAVTPTLGGRNSP
jgi:hypothetical protein